MKNLRTLINVGSVTMIMFIMMLQSEIIFIISYRDCNIYLKLNYKILGVLVNLKNYDSHLIIQELGKFNLKICSTRWIRKIYELYYQ